VRFHEEFQPARLQQLSKLRRFLYQPPGNWDINRRERKSFFPRSAAFSPLRRSEVHKLINPQLRVRPLKRPEGRAPGQPRFALEPTPPVV
jgi:hypothetical protein